MSDDENITVTIHGFIPSADEYYAIKERGIKVGAHRIVASLSEDGKEIVMECHCKQKDSTAFVALPGILSVRWTSGMTRNDPKSMTE